VTGHHPKIAVIGSGLAGALLSQELSTFADVTVFERGPAAPVRPHRPVVTRRPLGLFPSFAYGLGGTTGYWDGGLISMSLAEYGPHWPSSVSAQIGQYTEEVVRRLYGDITAKWWAGRQKMRTDCDLFLDEIIEPREPFRAHLSDCFRQVAVKLHHEIVGISETAGSIVVRANVLGEFKEYNFDIIILSAGGFNSPLLLRRSNLGGKMAGLNITDHPMGFVAKITSNRQSNNFRTLIADASDLHPFEPMLKVRDSQTGLWTAFYLRPTSTAIIRSDPLAQAFKASEDSSLGATIVKTLLSGPAQLRRPDFSSAHVFGRTFNERHAYILAVAEQETFGQGSVTQNEIGDIILEWNISDAVASSIDRSLDQLANWAGGSLTRAAGDLRNRLWSGAHHSGGCRISHNPTLGVVDQNLRVHGTNGIYVCDGSVLPSTGATNTGLTIGSLALRLADHISKTVIYEPARTASRRPNIPISGATGKLGRMVLPTLARNGFAPLAISFQKAVLPALKESNVFLHLANVSASVEDNINLQERVVTALTLAKIHKIIIPQSFSTFQAPPPKGPDPGDFNFGFGSGRIRDAYIIGKLAVEEFWINWQRQGTDRRVAFLYVPTILGPNSAWTRNIATHCQGRPIWVPAIPRFFSITEERLAEAVARLCSDGVPEGISRSIVFDKSGSLSEAVAWDRGYDDVCEVALPSAVWHAIALSKFDIADRLLNKALTLTNKSLRGRFAVLPVIPYYYAIFRSQSKFAGNLEHAARR
jgi:GMC oxidoreductase